MVRPLFRSRSHRVAPTLWLGLAALGALFVSGSSLAAGTLRGRVGGQDKLVADVYAEAAKDQHRYTWREPSPTVRAEFRALGATPRDIAVVATNSGSPPPMPPVLLRITGGRTAYSTVVVTPGTKIVFENRDPFAHRLVQKDTKFDINTGARNEWVPPGPGRYEFRDELVPSLRTFIVVDPQVASTTYPNREGAFSFPGIAPGEYVIKVFFQGKQVGKQVSLLVRDKLPTDIKEVINLADGADQK